MSFARAPAISLQPRDVALLRSLFESRIMTIAHAAELHFGGRSAAAKKRLQRLKSVGYLAERKRKPSEPSVLYLARKAFKLLGELGVLAEYPPIPLPALERRAQVSDLTIRHELTVMDLKAAWFAAIRRSKDSSIAEFGTWPLLYQFDAKHRGHSAPGKKVRPDGFIRMKIDNPDGDNSEHAFFLELDRSTEAQDILVSRAGSYLDHYQSGGFAVRRGALRSEFRKHPFRVLMVFKTAERRNNTAERLLQHNPPILTQVCLTTLEEALADPLGAIWICPLDYRNALKATAFDPTARQPSWGHRRQTERDFLIEQRVRRRRLWDTD